MRKYLLTCLILLLTVAAMAQQKTTINLIKSKQGLWTTVNGVEVYKVYQGVFQQKYSILQSDSAYVYKDQNTFDAFGHVVITQGDTLHIYSDKLNYNDNTKVAILTDNVKMVDKDATLTTNNLTYNTATKVGIYTGGGKLVNKDNVLVSKNGYYYAGPRDAYFRYDVVLTTPDALIKTDTLRYNSGSRIAYFYGPTNIYGKKDKDTLYTENGTYNTKTEQAFFGKKNRYSQGTKSLKGDSLFYDRLKGYGKAIKNITFEDREQKMVLKGNLGEYYKADDRAVVTQNPYVILVTEDKDTTKAKPDTAKLTLPTGKDKAAVPNLKTPPQLNKTGIAPPVATKGAAGITTDALLVNPQSIMKGAAKADSLKKALLPVAVANAGKVDSIAKRIAAMPDVKNTMPLLDKLKDSVKAKGIPGLVPPSTKGKAATTPVKTKPVLKNGKPVVTDTLKQPLKTDTIARVKRDSMYIGADTLETQVVTYKVLKELQEKRRLAGIRDTSVKARKPFEPYKTIPKFLTLDAPKLGIEPLTYMHRALFKVVKTTADTSGEKVAKPVLKDTKKPVTDSLKNKPALTTLKLKPGLTDSLKVKAELSDSLKIKSGTTDSLKNKQLGKNGKPVLKPVKPQLSDTSRVRILSAHHNVKIFKSDLQGKSDSLFYSSSDSIIRSFIKPMYWTQGAQLSGDTIFLQLKNKKLDNMNIFPSAFIVYIEEADSLHFNQVGGKRMKGYFKDSKLSRMDVNGNAETIYFNRNKNKVVTEMQRSLSSSITVNLKKGEAANMTFRLKPEHKFYPMSKVKDDDKILKNFIWKPKERPINKEAVINPVKPPVVKPAPKTPANGKPPVKGALTKPAGKDSVKTGTPAAKPATKDSVKAVLPVLKPTGQIKRDSLKKDSVKVLPAMKKDSVKSPKDGKSGSPK